MDRELQASGFKPLWVLEMAGLSRVYRMGRTEVYAVRGVSLRVATGEFVALMGPSGSGKSTLMHLLGCLETPTAGTYKLEGQDVGKLSSDERARVRNDRIGFVFQTFNLMTHLKALDNVALPLLYRGRVKSVKARAAEALAQVGLDDRAHAIALRSSPEASGSVSPLRVPWSATPPSSWRTNPPETWIRPPGKASCSC